MGMSREETLLIPFSELMDMICIHQIKMEGYRYKKPMTNKEELMQILQMR